MMSLTLNVPPSAKLTDEQFYELCQLNRDLRIERSAIGELIIMPPTGGETGKRNAKLTARFVIWNEQSELGEVFDSSTCFTLPNGANRSPDVAWIARDRWNALTPEQREKFPPICPDFGVELRSSSDALKPLQDKMQEYIANGVRLSWLLNYQERQVEIYRPKQAKEVLEAPMSLSGEAVLPGLMLDLASFW
ncbi:MAG TPA: Uma2 family endonuclease [Coleofasciculaceae cyanobacterium]|jgi:Uma2 family endonuclease